MRDVGDLDVISMISTLSVLSKTSTNLGIDVPHPGAIRLQEIELQVIRQIEVYFNNDISAVVASLLRLGHTPILLLELINKQNQMSTFGRDQCVVMLEALAGDFSDDKKYSVKQELFSKFFN